MNSELSALIKLNISYLESIIVFGDNSQESFVLSDRIIEQHANYCYVQIVIADFIARQYMEDKYNIFTKIEDYDVIG